MSGTFWTIEPPPYLSKDRPSVLAVDPGKACGLFYLPAAPGDDEHRDQGRMGEDNWQASMDWCEYLCASVPDLHVVCEAFTITPRTGSNTQAPWSLEAIGVLRHLTHRHSLTFRLQQPSLAKRGAPNDRLKHAGWYVHTTGGHVADAARHAYVYHLSGRYLSQPLLRL